jgi:amino acid transporter
VTQTDVRAGAVVRPRGTAWGLKRLLLGPALPTSQLIHERLGKPTALAVFASDNLSSVAYATEEILKVGVPVVGMAAFSLLMPVTFGILTVLAILLFSYRQTIKAYPSAGGAYVVTRDNFGLLPAQVAGVSLLTDYVLTVAVSVAAGVAAIASAAPALLPYRVELSLLFIWLIAWGNLRGVRESGRLFAAPTYFFIAMMFLLLGLGIARVLSGQLQPLPAPEHAVGITGTIGAFLVLHAFASGGAAVTGVEAISNGIPAFRPPEWRNARTTLMWMGSLLGIMFLGLSFLAYRLRVVPTETRTVVAQIGRAVFGGGPVGYGLFLALQIATTLILILAANTSFADFPRLASFQAGDAFMPRHFTTRGHRLVYSNGIVGLALAATTLVVAFRADVHRLIPLYAIGVFTSFTLSQAGMARRHLRLRERGWRRGLAINGLGAITTGVVALVVAVTKFAHGAWAVMVFVPLAVLLLTKMNRHYIEETLELETLEPFPPGPVEPPVVLLLVEQLDRKTLHALQYAKTVRSRSVRALHVERDPAERVELERRWAEVVPDVPLHVLRGCSDPASGVAGYIASLPQAADVNVIVPGPAAPRPFDRVRRWRTGTALARALLPSPNVRITLVRDHPGPGHPLITERDGVPRLRALPRLQHDVVVLVDRLDRATVRAIRYARSLGGTAVWAVHAAADAGSQEALIARWMELRIPVQLDVIECWDRDVARSLERYVVELMGRTREITVVMARRDYPRLRQRLLHDRTSRRIAKALGGYEHVDLTVVPYEVGASDRGPEPSRDVPVGTAVRAAG